MYSSVNSGNDCFIVPVLIHFSGIACSISIVNPTLADLHSISFMLLKMHCDFVHLMLNFKTHGSEAHRHCYTITFKLGIITYGKSPEIFHKHYQLLTELYLSTDSTYIRHHSADQYVIVHLTVKLLAGKKSTLMFFSIYLQYTIAVCLSSMFSTHALIL